MMTVKQLIAKLQEMPQDANIALDIINHYSGEGYSNSDDAEFEIFESTENEVVIQAID